MNRQINRNAKAMQSKSKSHMVEELSDHIFRVTSGTSDKQYIVRMAWDYTSATCTCDWGSYRPAKQDHVCGCSHVIAVYKWLAAQADARVSAWSSESDARRQHRPYRFIGDGLWITSRVS